MAVNHPATAEDHAGLHALVGGDGNLCGAIRAIVDRLDRIDAGDTPGLGKWMDGIQSAVAKLQAAETQAAGKPETTRALAEIFERLDRMDTDALREIALSGRTAERFTERIVSIERALAALNERITLAFRTWNAKGAEVPAPPSSADLDQRDRGLPKIIVPVRGVTVTCHRLGCTNRTLATSRTVDGMWFGLCRGCEGTDAAKPPEDFLTPPPLARKIGEAVLKAAAQIPDRKADAAATLARACDRIRDFWEKPGGGKDSLLVSLVEGLIMATADAKRAGVIP